MDSLFTDPLLSLQYNDNLPKFLGAKFTVLEDGSITDIMNKSFINKIAFPLLFEKNEYHLTQWLVDKLAKFRTDAVIAVTLSRDVLLGNETIPLAVSLMKKETAGGSNDIIVELQPLHRENLWQIQQNKYLPLFYHAFKNNTLPMFIVDKNLNLLAANDSYKELIHFTAGSGSQEINVTNSLSHASREKILQNHAKRLIDPASAPNKYNVDLVDSNGRKHSCLLITEIISPQQDSVISILGPLPPAAALEKTNTRVSFYQSPSITFLTSLSGRIMDANQSFFLLTGMDKKNLQNTFWFDLAAGFSKDNHHEIIHTLKADNSVENVKIMFRFPALSPQERSTLLSARLIQYNEVPAIIFTLTDVSNIPHLPADIFHMEELKVASELAASVGHEVRNPMTAVRGFLQMLSKKNDLNNYQSYFDIMLDELDRANQIISEYLSLAKTKTNKASMENINAIVEQLFPLLQITALNTKKKIFLDLSPTDDLYLDSKEIRQLILNIVKNGLESMDAGKSLHIKTYQASVNSIMLEIADEGSGIPPNILDKIGSPFFTTKRNGTGLGLPICYTIAEKNNAAIRIKSCDKGTTFFIEFTKL